MMKITNKAKLLFAGFTAAAIMMFAPRTAKADTIATFDDLSISTQLIKEPSLTGVTDNGIKVTSASNLFLIDGALVNGTLGGEPAGAADSTNYLMANEFQISNADGSPLDITKFDLGLGAGTATSGYAALSGYVNGVYTVDPTTLPLNDSMTTFTVPSMFNGASILYLQANGTDYDNLDNVVESTGGSSTPSPTPEPSSLLLLGTGLAAGALALRRRVTMHNLG
jgi:hypothetical protein